MEAGPGIEDPETCARVAMLGFEFFFCMAGVTASACSPDLTAGLLGHLLPLQRHVLCIKTPEASPAMSGPVLRFSHSKQHGLLVLHAWACQPLFPGKPAEAGIPAGAPGH